MDDLKFDRLENRFDELREDVSEIKIEQRVNSKLLTDLSEDFKQHKQTISEHIIGDNKIINHIQPLLQDLQEVVNDHKFTKEKKKRQITSIKEWSLKVGVVSTVSGIIYATLDYLFS